MSVRAVQVGVLPAPPGNPALVYAVPEDSHYGIYIWRNGAFERVANIDVGQRRAFVVRSEAWAPPVAAVIADGGWQLLSADATRVYLAIEVQLLD